VKKELEKRSIESYYEIRLNKADLRLRLQKKNNKNFQTNHTNSLIIKKI